MGRRKKHPAHENHERWLVSYADFITLLFAFFVVMFASSQSDKGKVSQISESVKQALRQDQFISVMAGILGGTVEDRGKGNAQMRGPGGAQKAAVEERDSNIVELLPAVKQLSQDLKQEIADGKLEVSLETRGLVVSLRQAAFFPSGDEHIAPEAYDAVRKMADVVIKLPNPIRLEGHTDSRPIKTVRFNSNWELSSARAISMLVLLTEKYGIDPKRFSIGGYADTVPVGSNETEEGRALNRRVDVVLLRQHVVVNGPLQDKPSALGPPPDEAKKR